jgi:integrase
LLLSAARQEEPESLRSIRVRAHALRHTFGVHSTAAEIPLDVTQQILGHASMATTIYVQGDRKRRLKEIGKLYREKR